MQQNWVRSLGWEDPLDEGNGNPLQYSCLENPMDRGAWWAILHRVAKSRTRLSDFTFFHIARIGLQVALVVKNLPANAGDKGRWYDPLIEKIPRRRKWQPTHILAWKIPWTKESGGLQSMGSQSWT